MTRIGVMQIVDSLAAGGMERMAVNLANHLPQDRIRSHLCTTRREGPLGALISPHVQQLHLARRGRFDLRALQRLTTYSQQHQIDILHAHGTSLFLSVLASRFKSRPAVVWHDNFGRQAVEERPIWIYGRAARFLSAVIAANESLAEWSRGRLRVAAERVCYLPNFVCEPGLDGATPKLPGTPGARVVCVANLRPEKDHLNLLRAMKRVVQRVPSAHLLLLGSAANPDYLAEIQNEIQQQDLAGHVSWLGCQSQVNAILKECDLGVLSSASEGLPLALLEYGQAGLPSVATRVGQCAEVLQEGKVGLLVPPASPEALADAMLTLLHSPEKRKTLGRQFQDRVRQFYNVQRALTQVCALYESVLFKQAQ